MASIGWIGGRLRINANRTQFAAVGVQHKGHGQPGWFIWLGKWRIWIRVQ